MQCKDIPTLEVLEFVRWRNDDGRHWCNWVFKDANDIHYMLYPDFPSRVVLAKMGKLIRAGLISGCPCGCRGDFEITDKGRKVLAAAGVISV